MDFKRANDPTCKTDMDHLEHHYSIALQEYEVLQVLDSGNVLTEKGRKHLIKLKEFLKKNLNIYMNITWMTKEGD